MRFLLDENIHAKLGKYLEFLGHDVKVVGKSLDDSELVRQSKSEERIIITHDTDLGNLDRYPLGMHSGVILVRINSLYLDKTQVAMDNLFKQVSEDTLKDKLFFVFEDDFFEEG